jgi:PPOX class probable F420-dependent enzyme
VADGDRPERAKVTPGRSAVAMTDDEVRSFLLFPHTMALATISPGGQPHLAAMWYGFVDDTLGFLTYRRSQKHRNIERDPRITCLFEDGSRHYENLRGVQLVGRAREVTGDVMERLAFDIVQRRQGPLDDAGRQGVRTGLTKRLGYVLEVERVVSWDHAKQSGLPAAADGRPA